MIVVEDCQALEDVIYLVEANGKVDRRAACSLAGVCLSPRPIAPKYPKDKNTTACRWTCSCVCVCGLVYVPKKSTFAPGVQEHDIHVEDLK